MSQQPETTFNQSQQTVIGPQTNIAGNQTVLEGGTHARRAIDLEAALAQLAALPSDHVPARADLPGNSHIPYAWNEHFVGRQPELMALASALRSENITAIVSGVASARSQQTVAAIGIGGIGKTQLAAAFAHCYGQYFLGGVYWLSFANPAAIETEIARCAELMDDLPQWVNILPLLERLPHIQRLWQEPLPRLLIFDNCEDPALLAQYRPKTGGCRVLVTSRRSRWSGTQGLRTVNVGTLPPAESVELLRKFSPPAHRPGWEDDQLAAVAEAVGHLPLALHLAGSYLRLVAPTLTPAHYLQQLQRSDLLQHESLQAGELSPTDHELHVERTFALSFAQLQADQTVDAAALKLLVRAALFAPGESIPLNLLYAAAGLADEENLILAAKAKAHLLDLGLLEEDEAGEPRLHRLLCQFVARRSQDQMADAQQDVESAVLRLAHQQHNTGDPRLLMRWHRQLRYVTDRTLLRQDESTTSLCNILGRLMQSIGNYTEAQFYDERALAICEEMLGAMHLGTAVSLNNLGMLLQVQGCYTSARSYFERALAIFEQVLGAKHPQTAVILNNLGYLLNSMGDYVSARPYLKQALTILDEMYGMKHPDIAASLNNLGYALQAQGDYEGAYTYYERALTMREELLGEKHPQTAQSLNNLGYLLNSMGNYNVAQTYFERALAIREEVLGASHPDTAISLNNLGVLLQAQGDYASARFIYEKVLKIWEEVLGEKHPQIAQSLSNLGDLLRTQGDYLSARSYLERALMICEEMLGEKHPQTAQSLNNLGVLLQAQGDYLSARLYFERALAIRESVLGAKHPDTATSFNNLGILAYCEGKKHVAIQYPAKALAIYEAVLGRNYPYTQGTRQSLTAIRAELNSNMKHHK